MPPKKKSLKSEMERIDKQIAFSKGLEMHVPLSDSEAIPIRSFVTNDIEGYFLEFGKIQKFEKPEE